MKRSEFLEKLREALENDLSGRIVQENVDYYNSYITEEVRKGRAEETVIAELGDPWVIARSVVEMADSTAGTQDGYSTYESAQSKSSESSKGGQNYGAGGNMHMYSLDAWWKKLLLILAIIGIVGIVIAIIGGIFSLLMPILVPVLIIMLVLKLVGGNRR